MLKANLFVAARLRGEVAHVLAQLKSSFYPSVDSVTKDYWEYMKWGHYEVSHLLIACFICQHTGIQPLIYHYSFLCNTCYCNPASVVDTWGYCNCLCQVS